MSSHWSTLLGSIHCSNVHHGFASLHPWLFRFFPAGEVSQPSNDGLDKSVVGVAAQGVPRRNQAADSHKEPHTFKYFCTFLSLLTRQILASR